MKRTTTTLVLSSTVALLGVAACGGGSDPLSGGDTTATTSAGRGVPIIVGSANFPESELLAEIYAGALKAKGVTVATKLNIGSRETYLPAMADGSINLVPEYTGVLAVYFGADLGRGKDPEAVFNKLKSVVPEKFTVLDKAEAQDKDGVVVSRASAAKYNLKTIEDLGPVAKTMVLGGPPEWATRKGTGVPELYAVYGLTFKKFRALDVGGPLTVQALKNNLIQAGNLFTTDPNIPANGFVSLEDNKSMFAAQNVVPLITKTAVNDTVSGALNAVQAKLTTVALATLVKQVVIDKKDSADVAQSFLTLNKLG